jgi:hypothetical protein
LNRCQQIHYAGNLAIASTAFIGIAFLLTLVMCVASVLFLTGNGNSNSGVSTSAADPEEDVAAENHKGRHGRHHGWQPAQQTVLPKSALGAAAPYLNLTLITLLLLGAVMYFIAQFYGVEGLVQSAPDNAGMLFPFHLSTKIERASVTMY